MPAAAQVVRCTDAATGRITYTDGACVAGESARQVQAQRSAQEVALEREQATQALARVQQERQQRQERELQEQQLRAQTASRPPAATPGPAASAACARARQRLQQALASPNPGLYDEQLRVHDAQGQVELACLTADEQARAWAARSPAAVPAPMVVLAPPRRPLPPPPPPAAPRRDYTSCNVFRCYDGQGNAHPR